MAQRTNTDNTPKIVRDLIGRRVRMTYYQRESYTRGIDNVPPGTKGVFDIDRVAEGTLRYYQTVDVSLPYERKVFLYDIANNDETVNTNVPLLLPTDSLVNEGDFRLIPSEFDGRRNGSWEIVAIEDGNG